MKNHSDQTPEGNMNIGGAKSPNLGAGRSRRRFIKGGAAATPVILTFTSRPVLGFDQMCLTPSRMISGNHSGFTGPTTCSGTSLSAYKISADKTFKPSWYRERFTTVFGSKNAYASTAGTIEDRLGDVFLDSYAGHDATTAQFAAYLIAAHLNALNGTGVVETVLTTAQVKHMWNDVIGTGQYCPQIAMCWDATEVIAYLQYSGIVPAA